MRHGRKTYQPLLCLGRLRLQPLPMILDAKVQGIVSRSPIVPIFVSFRSANHFEIHGFLDFHFVFYLKNIEFLIQYQHATQWE